MATIINKATQKVLENISDEWAKKLVRHQPQRFAYAEEIVEQTEKDTAEDTASVQEVVAETVSFKEVDTEEDQPEALPEKTRRTRKPRSKKAN